MRQRIIDFLGNKAFEWAWFDYIMDGQDKKARRKRKFYDRLYFMLNHEEST